MVILDRNKRRNIRLFCSNINTERYYKYYGGVMNKEESYILTVRLTKKEEEIVKKLKGNYSVNISQFIRNKIVKLEEELRKKIGGEL